MQVSHPCIAWNVQDATMFHHDISSFFDQVLIDVAAILVPSIPRNEGLDKCNCFLGDMMLYTYHPIGGVAASFDFEVISNRKKIRNAEENGNDGS